MKRPMRKDSRRTRIWSDRDLLTLLQMSDDGWTDDEISQHFKVDADEVISVRNACLDEAG